MFHACVCRRDWLAGHRDTLCVLAYLPVKGCVYLDFKFRLGHLNSKSNHEQPTYVKDVMQTAI